MARRKTIFGWCVVSADNPNVRLSIIRDRKQCAINAYLNECDNGWTWKRVYATGMRVKRVKIVTTITVES